MRKIRSFLFAILAMTLLQGSLQSCRSSEDSSEEQSGDPMTFWKNIELIPVQLKEGGKWSMINANGEIVYKNYFTEQPSVAYNGLFSVMEGDGFSVYSTGDETPKLVAGLKNLMHVGSLEDGLMPVTFPGERISLVDKTGKTKFELNPIDGVEIVSCAPYFEDGLLWVETDDDKLGYIDTTGEVVIKPIYDTAGSFSEGLAVVGCYKDGTLESMIINKKGETVFRLDSEFYVFSSEFQYGYIFAKRDDQCYMIDKQGSKHQLPSTITFVIDYNDTYLIFMDENSNMGIAKIDGEIVVRPKYSMITIADNDTFLVKKDLEDDSTILINADGEKIGKKLDYYLIENFAQFGYGAFGDNHRGVLLNKDFQEKSKVTFNECNIYRNEEILHSDYFDRALIATKMVRMIDNTKTGTISLGDAPGEILTNQTPLEYNFFGKTSYFFDLSQRRGSYDIFVEGTFSEDIVDYNPRTQDYFWNPDSKLLNFRIEVNAKQGWGEKGQQEFIKALKAAGYKMVKEDTIDDYYLAGFEKGNITVIATSDIDGTEGYIQIYNKSAGKEILEHIVPIEESERMVDLVIIPD